MNTQEGSRPCNCRAHEGVTCHRKRRYNRRYCSGCIDFCDPEDRVGAPSASIAGTTSGGGNRAAGLWSTASLGE